MIPVGLRRRPQFVDLMNEILIDPHTIRYPNRDAKQLRDGFVFSQYDEENNRQMLDQQLQVNNIEQRMILLRKAAAEAGISHAALRTITDESAILDIVAAGALSPEQQAAAEAALRQEEATRQLQERIKEQMRQQAIGTIAAQSFGDSASSSAAASAPQSPWITVEPPSLGRDAAGTYRFIIKKRIDPTGLSLEQLDKLRNQPQDKKLSIDDLTNMIEEYNGTFPTNYIHMKIETESDKKKAINILKSRNIQIFVKHVTFGA